MTSTVSLPCIVEPDRPPSPFLQPSPFPSTSTASPPPEQLALPSTSRTHKLSTESFSAPSIDDTDRVLKVYRAIEKAPRGVRGDGYAEGVELTRERRGASWSGRWEDMMQQKRWSVDQAKEDEVLAKTDRYGFFNAEAQMNGTAHHRAAKLTADAFADLPKPRSSASKGKARAVPITDAPVSITPTLNPTLRKKEDERIDKWAKMLVVAERDAGGNATRWTFAPDCLRTSASGTRLTSRKRVYKGVPDRWRPAAWTAMLDLAASASSTPSLYSSSSAHPSRRGSVQPPSPTGSTASTRSRFSIRRRTRSPRSSVAPPLPAQNGSSALTPAEVLIKRRRGEEWDAAKERFDRAEDQPCDQDVQIDLDVPRTVSGHVFFHTRYGKGQRALFRVLHAFALLCPECGYCQGMGPIACTLLGYFEPSQAYAALVRLHDGHRFGLHSVFAPGFPGLGVLFGLQERLTAYLMPDVAEILTKQSIGPSMYATKWYITLFANVVPFAVQLRIWDAFLLDGRDVLVLVAVAIVWACRGRLLADDFEISLSLLSSFFVPESDDALLDWIRRVGSRADVRSRMHAWSLDSSIGML